MQPSVRYTRGVVTPLRNYADGRSSSAVYCQSLSVRDYLTSSTATPFSHVVRSYPPLPPGSPSRCSWTSLPVVSSDPTPGSRNSALLPSYPDFSDMSQEKSDLSGGARPTFAEGHASQRPHQAASLGARTSLSSATGSMVIGANLSQSPLQGPGRPQTTMAVEQIAGSHPRSGSVVGRSNGSTRSRLSPPFTDLAGYLDPNKQVSDASVSTSAESLLPHSGSSSFPVGPGVVERKGRSLDSVPSPSCLRSEDEGACRRASIFFEKAEMFEDSGQDIRLKPKATAQQGSPGEEGTMHTERGFISPCQTSSTSPPYIWLRADQVYRRVPGHPDLGLYGEVMGSILVTLSPTSMHRALVAFSEALEPIERAYVMARAEQRVRLAIKKSTELMAELAVGEVGNQHWSADVCVAVRSPLSVLIPLGRIRLNDTPPGPEEGCDDALVKKTSLGRRVSDMRGGVVRASGRSRPRRRNRDNEDRRLPHARSHCDNRGSSEGRGRSPEARRARRPGQNRTTSGATGKGLLDSVIGYDGFLGNLGIWVVDSRILLPVPGQSEGGNGEREARERSRWSSGCTCVPQLVESGERIYADSPSFPPGPLTQRQDEVVSGMNRNVAESRGLPNNSVPLCDRVALAATPWHRGSNSESPLAAGSGLSLPPYDRYAVLCSGLSVSRVHSCAAFLHRIHLCCCDRCLLRACTACHCSCGGSEAVGAPVSPASASGRDHSPQKNGCGRTASGICNPGASSSSMEVLPDSPGSVSSVSCSSSGDEDSDNRAGETRRGRLQNTGTDESASKRTHRGADGRYFNEDRPPDRVTGTAALWRERSGRQTAAQAGANSPAFHRTEGKPRFFDAWDHNNRGELAVFLLHYACFRFCGDVCHLSARLTEQRRLLKLRALFQDDSPK